MKSLKLIIEGQPISKQSVKQGRSWKGKKVFYQPAKYKLIELKYKYQIKAQLPPGFQMFTKKKVYDCRSKIHDVFSETRS